MKALVIDDNPGILMLLTDILTEMGIEVTESTDCKEAWEIIQKSDSFDFHLIDWMTPHMSGLELLKLIKSSPRYEKAINIMVTGLTEVDEVRQALESGANEYLMKPFTSEMLEDKLSLCGIEVPKSRNASSQFSQGAV